MSGEAKNTDASGRSKPSDKGGPSHPDPEVRGGWGRSRKKFFWALQASVWSKNKGGPRPPGPLS